MKHFLFLTVFSVLIASIIPVNTNYAQQQKKIHKFLNKRSGFIENLDLTKEQKNQIDKFRLEHRKEAIDLRADISKNRLQIEELMKDQNLDESKIRSLVNTNSELQAKLKESALNMWLKSYSVLDDKQKELWREHTPWLDGGGRKFNNRIQHSGGRGLGLGFNDEITLDEEIVEEIAFDEYIYFVLKS